MARGWEGSRLIVQYATNAELRKGLRKWQRTLGLLDWQIKARLIKSNEIADGCVAHCLPCLLHRSATIGILDSLSRRDSTWPHDHEHSLIHELLHLPLGLVEESLGAEGANGEKPESERFINQMADALLRADRRKNSVRVEESSTGGSKIPLEVNDAAYDMLHEHELERWNCESPASAR